MSNNKGTTKKKVNKKKKQDTEEIIRRSLKRSTGFMGSLLVNAIIVFFVIKLFVYSFNFAYSVFGDVCKSPGDKEYVVVEVPADSSILQIGGALEKAEIIDDKYVFFAKVKVKGYGDKIRSGKFGLSASMTYEEILDVLCGITDEKEEEK